MVMTRGIPISVPQANARPDDHHRPRIAEADRPVERVGPREAARCSAISWRTVNSTSVAQHAPITEVAGGGLAAGARGPAAAGSARRPAPERDIKLGQLVDRVRAEAVQQRPDHSRDRIGAVRPERPVGRANRRRQQHRRQHGQGVVQLREWQQRQQVRHRRDAVSSQCSPTMLYPMNWSSLQVGTEPRAWIASTSNSRTFRAVFSRSESPMNVQPSNRLRRKSASAHPRKSRCATRSARPTRMAPGEPGSRAGRSDRLSGAVGRLGLAVERGA